MVKEKSIKTIMLGACASIVLSPSMSFANSETRAIGSIVTDAEDAVLLAENNKTTSDIQSARELVNSLEEGVKKEELQTRLNGIVDLTDFTFTKYTTTSNVDVYIKCENILIMTLDTNSITFEDFSGVEDMEKTNAVNITINSSLPYEINAYLPTEIQNSDKSRTMDKRILSIKANSETQYKEFTGINTKLSLLDNQPAGNDIVHPIDLKLNGSIAHEKDVYKTTIKFEAQQK